MKTTVDHTIHFIYVQQFTVALHGREADMLINEALSTNKADYECDNQINMLDKHSNVPK